jgi:hypothetical protein
MHRRTTDEIASLLSLLFKVHIRRLPRNPDSSAIAAIRFGPDAIADIAG